MSWFKQTDYKDLNQDQVSLLVAMSNLLLRLDRTLTPPELLLVLTQDEPAIDWWNLGEYIEGMDIGEVIQDADGSWPNSSFAIIKFRRLDEASAGYVDHYCLVADHHTHSIIDTLDGTIKPGGTYGPPLAWASYVQFQEDEEDPIGVPVEPKPGTTYKVLRGGESVWEIARRLNVDGMTGKDIAEHNELDPTKDVPGGTVLHLPKAIPQKPKEKIVDFEILDEPLDMHIIKPGGARKYAFGNARKWTHISESGRNYPENTNIKIYAIAHVPLPDEGDDIEAAYYMDGLDVGNFNATGRIQHTVGFNHSHLAEGEAAVELPKPEPKAELKEKLEEAKEAIEQFAKQEVEPALEAENVLDNWQSTIKPLNADHKPVSYIFDEDVTIKELTGKRQPAVAKSGKSANVCCTVWKDGEQFGLPTAHHISSLLFGLPLDKMTPEDELFVGLSDEERIGAGKLTDLERYWYVPLAKVSSQYVRLKALLNKNNKAKEPK